MKNIKIGKLIAQLGGFQASIPNSFPPEGGFEFSPAILVKDNQATHLLGKLDGIPKFLPDANFFLPMYLREDAAYSKG